MTRLNFKVKLGQDWKSSRIMGPMKWSLEVSSPRTSKNNISLKLTCESDINKEHKHSFPIHSNLWKIATRLKITFIDKTDEERLFQVKIVTFDANKLIHEENFEMKNVTIVNVEVFVKRLDGIRLELPFDFTKPVSSDVTFLVEDRKIYAHRSILSGYSDHFAEFFARNSSTIVEAESDVDYYEFVEMLQAVYSMTNRVTDENVGYLLKLADAYKFERLVRQCVEHLDSTNTLHFIDLINYAENHNLVEILKKFVILIGDVDQYELLMNEEKGKQNKQLNPLNDKWQLMILDKKCQLENKNSVNQREGRKIKNDPINLSSWGNVMLKFHNTDIMVNRAFMSVHSAVFENKFRDGESEYAMTGDPDKFCWMLDYMMLPEKDIGEEYIEALADLSSTFKVEFLANKIEKILINSQEFSVVNKWKISGRNRLCHLQAHCFDENLVKEIDLESLDEKSKLLLLLFKESPSYMCTFKTYPTICYN